MTTFRFFYRNVYGFQKAYPANGPAERFARLLGVKTFSTNQLQEISDLGFELEAVSDPAAPAGWRKVTA